MRQIVLDTETTGLDPDEGHRIIEIGCIELFNRRITRRRFHTYLNPERHIDAGAVEVHGLSSEFLQDKPRFCEIVEDFLNFVKGAELIIHNAPFDVGFLNHELRRLGDGHGELAAYCSVLDTLVLAKKNHPGQRNNLDALCKRYNVDNSHRELHGALLDAEILAEVYLAMTGGQTDLPLEPVTQNREIGISVTQRIPLLQMGEKRHLKVIPCSTADLEAHHMVLEAIRKTSPGKCIWLAGID